MNLKKIVKKGWKYFKDKEFRFLVNSKVGLYNKMSDEKYLKKAFKIRMKQKLDLDNPKTFNEKLQWLKLNDRKPEYTNLVDKYKVREYIAKTIGEEYLIPLLGVYNNADEIDFEKLPNRFVLKCNHNSGGLCICKDKSKLNIEKVKKDLNKALKQDYYLTGREWPYKNVERKIICEQYMEDDETQELRDYKFMCFDGNVDSVMLCMDRKSGETKFYFFDKDWKLLKYNYRGINAPKDFTVQKPKCIDKMFKIAEVLSKGFPFMRVDLYCCNEKIYFGELTFFPESGMDPNLIKQTDEYFGNLIKIRGEND